MLPLLGFLYSCNNRLYDLYQNHRAKAETINCTDQHTGHAVSIWNNPCSAGIHSTALMSTMPAANARIANGLFHRRLEKITGFSALQLKPVEQTCHAQCGKCHGHSCTGIVCSLIEIAQQERTNGGDADNHAGIAHLCQKVLGKDRLIRRTRLFSSSRHRNGAPVPVQLPAGSLSAD